MKKIMATVAILLISSTAQPATELDTDSSGSIDIALGGTNAETPAEARTNLGLAIGTDVLAPDGDGSALTSVDAATGDSATGFFDAGTIEHEYGGVEADVSAYSGLIGVSGGATTEVDTADELETFAGLGAFANEFLDDADAAAVRTTLEAQQLNAGLTDISGITGAQGGLIFFDGLNWDQLSPGTSGYFLKTQGAGANPVWAAPTGGGDVTAVGTCVAGDCFTDGSTTSTSLIFEMTDNAFETSLTASEPTADRTVTLPDETGTIMLGPAGLGTDNILMKTDGTGNLTQATGISVDDSNNLSSVGTIGSGAITSSGTVTGGTLTDGTLSINSGLITGLVEGGLPNSSVVSDDIKDGEVATADLAATLDLSGKTVTFGLESGDIPDLSATYEAVDAEILRADTADDISEVFEIQDDTLLNFGNDADFGIRYDETTDNQLEVVSDSASDTEIDISNAGSGAANLTVDGVITSSEGISAPSITSTAADGSRRLSLTNNTTGNQPSAATVVTGFYSYEADLYTIVNSKVMGYTDSATGDVFWQGATDNSFSYQIDLTDPTAARTITVDDNNIDFSDTTEDYVLKYNASTRTWSGEADSTGSALGSNLSSAADSIDSDTDIIDLQGTTTNISLNLGTNDTNGVLMTFNPDGDFTIKGQGDGSDEDLNVNLDDTANVVSITSSTGVATVDFNTIGLAAGSFDASEGNVTNVGNIALDSMSADGASISISSATDVDAAFTATSVAADAAVTGATVTDGTVTLAGDGTITGVSVGGLPDNIVDNGMMADNAIDTAELADDAVGTAELANDLDILTTGTIQGMINTATKSSSATLTVPEVSGSFIVVTAAATMTLPTAAAGYSVCIASGQGSTAIIQVAPASGDYLVASGVRGTAATAYASSGAAGDRICLIAANTDDWYITSEVGTWSE